MPETAGTESQGRRNMRYGALWCILGIILLTLSYLAAAAGVVGGRHVLAWVVILFGGFRLIRGMIQSFGRFQGHVR
jgi:hypothetical protein